MDYQKFPRCTHTLRAAGQYYPRTCAECGPFGPCKVQHAPLAQPEIIKGPGATAAPAESVDTPKLWQLIATMMHTARNGRDDSTARTDIVARINTWGAQRYEAGRQYQDKVDLETLLAMRARAERAEAALASVYSAFHIGEMARELPILMENLRNTIRRADCLDAIERALNKKG